MSSFRMRRILLISLLVLAGCGYGPAYGPEGPAEQLRQNVSVKAPKNENEFNLVKQLELRLGHSGSAEYNLTYNIATGEDAIAYTPGRDVSRYNVVGKVSFSLRKVGSKKVLHASSVDAFTSYTVGVIDTDAIPPSTGATISTFAAERDAYRRLMVILADQMVTRLIATSGSWSE